MQALLGELLIYVLAFAKWFELLGRFLGRQFLRVARRLLSLWNDMKANPGDNEKQNAFRND